MIQPLRVLCVERLRVVVVEGAAAADEKERRESGSWAGAVAAAEAAAAAARAGCCARCTRAGGRAMAVRRERWSERANRRRAESRGSGRPESVQPALPALVLLG